MTDVKHERSWDEDGRRYYDRDLLIVPNCCEAVQATAAVHLRFLGDDIDERDGQEGAVPRWWVKGHRLDEELEFPPEIEPKFCPFCGTALPEPQKRKVPLGPVAVVSDGGYRCDTCGERLMICTCWPCEAAWEVPSLTEPNPAS